MFMPTKHHTTHNITYLHDTSPMRMRGCSHVVAHTAVHIPCTVLQPSPRQLPCTSQRGTSAHTCAVHTQVARRKAVHTGTGQASGTPWTVLRAHRRRNATRAPHTACTVTLGGKVRCTCAHTAAGACHTAACMAGTRRNGSCVVGELGGRSLSAACNEAHTQAVPWFAPCRKARSQLRCRKRRRRPRFSGTGCTSQRGRTTRTCGCRTQGGGHRCLCKAGTGRSTSYDSDGARSSFLSSISWCKSEAIRRCTATHPHARTHAHTQADTRVSSTMWATDCRRIRTACSPHFVRSSR